MKSHACICCGPHPKFTVLLDGIDVTSDCVCADSANGFVVLYEREEGDTRPFSRKVVNGRLSKIVRFGKVVIEESL